MKKRNFLLMLSILIVLVILIFIIKGGFMTGKISVQPTNISIQVLPTPPTLSIISPENETYLTNENLLLNYSVSYEDFVCYNIDHAGNTTISSAIYFNTTQGTHTLYLYANNSYGTVEENITFSANSTAFIIYHSEYNGSARGNSTNFSQYTYEELQNLSDVILERSQQGKIEFNETINLTNDLNSGDNELDLDTSINISSNRIEINSTVLPNFNVSATLYLYGLTFSTPRILKDGGVCPSTICTQESYSGGTLKFNVTHFTVYSAEETPGGATLSGGSGGGTGLPILKDFSLNKETISATLKQGETIKKELIITNNGNQELSITIQNPTLANFLKISETEFNLNAGEFRVIDLDFLVREETFPDLYMGKLIIKGNEIEKEILIAIEVETKSPLFDINTEIPDKFFYVLPGEELYAKVAIFNLGNKKADVILDYFIKDEDGKEMISEHETMAVGTQATTIKIFRVPRDIKYGKYIFYVKATYDGETASSSAWFNVGEEPFFSKETLISILLILIITVTLIIAVCLIKKKVTKKKRKKNSFKDYKKRIRMGIEKNKK